ncbi:hypothetical protein Sjap_013754 [Stephania japonica]|uniref:Uncharacterized protein n=1 Tax=Stephania japonica TaxID=461633 RepID=A0AAP0IYD7_9MAGN
MNIKLKPPRPYLLHPLFSMWRCRTVYRYSVEDTSRVSNLIYVDQPTGTGFSYSSESSDRRDLRHDEAMIFMISCRK